MSALLFQIQILQILISVRYKFLKFYALLCFLWNMHKHLYAYVHYGIAL